MSLQGRLPEFNVVDVLHIVASAGKTGVVRFSRGQGELALGGAIYFRDGKPVAAEADGMAGEEAVEQLCSWTAGSFAYHDGATSPRETLTQPLDGLVEQARSALVEWREIRRVLPPLSSTVRLVAELPADVAEVQLGRDDWDVLARMLPPRALSALAEQAGGRLAAYRVLRKFVEEGLLRVETQEPRARTVESGDPGS